MTKEFNYKESKIKWDLASLKSMKNQLKINSRTKIFHAQKSLFLDLDILPKYLRLILYKTLIFYINKKIKEKEILLDTIRDS